MLTSLLVEILTCGAVGVREHHTAMIDGSTRAAAPLPHQDIILVVMQSWKTIVRHCLLVQPSRIAHIQIDCFPDGRLKLCFPWMLRRARRPYTTA